jgi:ABC-2 type transport system permease protein
VAQNLTFSVLCWWLFGLFTVALVTLFSVLCTGNTGVLLGTGGVVLACYLLGLLPDLSKYLPTRLADGNSLIFGLEEPSAYTASLTLTAILTVLCLVLSVPIFNRKHL